jgi:two-component sensor histidine kinase
LLKFLDASFGKADDCQQILLSSEPLQVPVEFCINCGLILTELVSNAFKHAVSPQTQRVAITIRPVQTVVKILVQDSGPGFPEDFDLARQDGFGFRLIKALVKKYDGSISIGREPDTSVLICLTLDGLPNGISEKSS